MKILHLDEIKRALEGKDLLPATEAGFAAYSSGKAVDRVSLVQRFNTA